MARMGFGDADLDRIEAEVASTWRADPVIQGMKGVRKTRIARPGTGKSSGARVIYYLSLGHGFLAMLTAYPKSAQSDLSSEDRKMILRIVAALTNGGKK